MLNSEIQHFLLSKGCSRKKGVGLGCGWWNGTLKWGYHQHNFIFFYGTVHMDIPENTPTHLILIDFSSIPDALFPGTALYNN